MHSKFSQNPRIPLLIMLMTILGQASIALYLPAFLSIAQALHFSPSTIKNTVTIFLLGFGLSQLIYGPLSDRYGRKPLLLVGILIFCLGCVINIFSKTSPVFLLARLIQGLGVGATLTNGRAILKDCFSGRDLASKASYASMGFAIGFGVSPFIGAYLSHYFGWRTDFVFLLLAGLCLVWMLAKFLPETAPHLSVKTLILPLIKNTLTDYRFILSQLSFLQFLLGGVFAYTVFVAYNVMTPLLIQGALGFSENTYGQLALLVAIPYYSAASLNRKLVLKFGTGPVFALGSVLIILSGLLMLFSTWLHSNGPLIHLLYILVPMMGATFGQALIFSNSIAGALHPFSSELSGKASALFSGLQILLVSVFSALMAWIPDHTQLPLALIILLAGLFSGLALWTQIRQ